MAGKHRTLRIAICATVAALAFVYSLAALAPKVLQTWSGGDEASQGVYFVFQTYRCPSEQLDTTPCYWFGNVTQDGKIIATEVEFRDEAPSDIVPGQTAVAALWTFQDPHIAWDIDSERAWFGTAASALLSGIVFVAMALAAVVWWRRFFKESAEKRASTKESSSRADRQERQDSAV